MKKILLALLIVVILVLGYLFLRSDNKDTGSESDETITGNDNDEEEVIIRDPEEKEIDYNGLTFVGLLSDVTGGVSVSSVQTGGAAEGVVRAGVADGEYHLRADFTGIPDPENEEFYEGWIVRRQPMNVVSTGRVNLVEGRYVNIFSASDNSLIDHNFYVLTIEPDDGDPAPAGHILEGTLVNRPL